MTIEIRERGADPSQPAQIAGDHDVFATFRVHEKDGIKSTEFEMITLTGGRRLNFVKGNALNEIGAPGLMRPFSKMAGVDLDEDEINSTTEPGRLSGLSFTYVPEETPQTPTSPEL